MKEAFEGRYKDISNQKFGLLTPRRLIGYTEKNKYGRRYAIWICDCECGGVIVRSSDVIKRGKSSCGCVQEENLRRMSKNNITHGMTGTRLYRIFKGMHDRCYYEKSDHYNAYGKRGIKICDEWLKDKGKFIEWALNNGYREDLTIERIDVNGDYCPENCCWIPLKDQYKNKQSNHNKMPLPEPYKPEKGEQP